MSNVPWLPRLQERPFDWVFDLHEAAETMAAADTSFPAGDVDDELPNTLFLVAYFPPAFFNFRLPLPLAPTRLVFLSAVLFLVLLVSDTATCLDCSVVNFLFALLWDLVLFSLLVEFAALIVCFAPLCLPIVQQ